MTSLLSTLPTYSRGASLLNFFHSLPLLTPTTVKNICIAVSLKSRLRASSVTKIATKIIKVWLRVFRIDWMVAHVPDFWDFAPSVAAPLDFLVFAAMSTSFFLFYFFEKFFIHDPSKQNYLCFMFARRRRRRLNDPAEHYLTEW